MRKFLSEALAELRAEGISGTSACVYHAYRNGLIRAPRKAPNGQYVLTSRDVARVRAYLSQPRKPGPKPREASAPSAS